MKRAGRSLSKRANLCPSSNTSKGGTQATPLCLHLHTCRQLDELQNDLKGITQRILSSVDIPAAETAFPASSAGEATAATAATDAAAAAAAAPTAGLGGMDDDLFRYC